MTWSPYDLDVEVQDADLSRHVEVSLHQRDAEDAVRASWPAKDHVAAWHLLAETVARIAAIAYMEIGVSRHRHGATSGTPVKTTSTTSKTAMTVVTSV
jgi:hypothetical protein